MRIDRMKEGALYKIKPNISLDVVQRIGPQPQFPVLRGWRDVFGSKDSSSLPPFVYLGYKKEDWAYHYHHTKKIHYVMWQGDIWVMDNQFAKHIIPVWDGEEDGQDRGD